jgi:hypothetical protein
MYYVIIYSFTCMSIFLFIHFIIYSFVLLSIINSQFNSPIARKTLEKAAADKMLEEELEQLKSSLTVKEAEIDSLLVSTAYGRY